MPEHVHLLVSEPERSFLSTAIHKFPTLRKPRRVGHPAPLFGRYLAGYLAGDYLAYLVALLCFVQHGFA